MKVDSGDWLHKLRVCYNEIEIHILPIAVWWDGIYIVEFYRIATEQGYMRLVKFANLCESKESPLIVYDKFNIRFSAN